MKKVVRLPCKKAVRILRGFCSATSKQAADIHNFHRETAKSTLEDLF